MLSVRGLVFLRSGVSQSYVWEFIFLTFSGLVSLTFGGLFFLRFGGNSVLCLGFGFLKFKG